MMTQSSLWWLLACLPLGAAAGGAAGRLSGVCRPWTIPAALVGQGVVGVSAVLATPPPWWPLSFLLGWALLTLALVDGLDFRLPDALTFPLMAAGLALGAAAGELSGPVIGAAAGWGTPTILAALYRRWRGRDGLGRGDAKLLAAAGAWMGWEALPVVVLLACMAALAVITALRLTGWRTFTGNTAIPFGPALCCGIWLVWLYGPAA